MADSQWVHRGDLTRVRSAYLAGHQTAPYDALVYCRAERKKVPVWVLDAILDDYRSGRITVACKRAGRHARTEERMKQFQNDANCLFTVRSLMAAGKKQTPAEAETARQLNLSQSAVHKAVKRAVVHYRKAAEQGGWMQI